MMYRVMQKLKYLYVGVDVDEAHRMFRAAAGPRATFECDISMGNSDPLVMALDSATGDLLCCLYGITEEQWKQLEKSH